VYDDLARTQQLSFLELVVVRCVIPTVLTSFLLQSPTLSSRIRGLEYTDCFCDCFFEGSVPMSGFSSVTAITLHAALGAALLLGTTKSARSTQPVLEEQFIVFPQPASASREAGNGPTIPPIPIVPDLPPIRFDPVVLQSGASTAQSRATTSEPRASAGGSDERGGWGTIFSEVGPEILAGPLPAYPELLRHAGVEGQVVLEARVDSTGRVQRASVSVVSATHPGFVEPARQALLATLFRPARVNGRAVLMLVRVPFAFSIRGGTGRAR
jgi:periplasmic protein TonB